MEKLKKALAVTMASFMAAGLAACGSKPASSNTPETSAPVTSEAVSTAENNEDFLQGDPLKFSIYYSDNPTLPFKSDWLAVTTIEKRYNTDITWEIIPSTDYNSKVSITLNTGTNTPDVILYANTQGETSQLALNGALVPLSDYSDWTPNFNAYVEKFGIQDTVDMLNLSDGKRYVMPPLYDQAFYDGGLILRQDFLEKNNFAAPKTYDDLYAILKAYKEQNPKSYPLTVLAAPNVLYRMTMPSFGVSLGKNASTGAYVLSWDYDKKECFPGAISEEYKEYITFFHKLYAEGLLDPEMAAPIDGDKWNQKLATGAAIASYAYYDQIGGIEAVSDIEGIKFNLYPPLAGPDGAHHQPKNKTGIAKGLLLPIAVTKRPDFERLVRTIDAMFYSEEAAAIWCLGVEGETYTMDGNKIVFPDDAKNSPDGIYKYMQLKYGTGSDTTQKVWISDREMYKYDDNYRAINEAVAAMDDAIQYIPPTPMFDDLDAEEASSLQTPLADSWERWNDAFLTGEKSIEKDWDAYVAEMKTLQIDRLCELYNANLPK